MSAEKTSAPVSPTFALGGDLSINRMGYGGMQLTGEGVWGPPADPKRAVEVLRAAVDLGVTFIDTADAYGPHVVEELIAEAFHPYPQNLVIGTKGGLVRYAPSKWGVCGKPVYLKQCVEMSLRRLRLDAIPLYQLHRIDEDFPLEDQLGALAEFQQQGKIRHIGLSEVSVDEIEKARQVVDIASVQNRYSVGRRNHEDVVRYCEREGIAFIPWYPLEAGKLAGADGPVAEAARRLGATPSQIALAWLLRHSPVIIPIPGTSRVKHLEENIAAGDVALPDDLYDLMTRESAPNA